MTKSGERRFRVYLKMRLGFDDGPKDRKKPVDTRKTAKGKLKIRSSVRAPPPGVKHEMK